MSNTYFSDAGVNYALNAESDEWFGLNSASPGITGANEIAGGSYQREATTWSGAAGSSRPGSQIVVNVPAGVSITHFSVWSAQAGGTYKRGGPLRDPATGNPVTETFGAAGTLALTPTLTASG